MQENIGEDFQSDSQGHSSRGVFYQGVHFTVGAAVDNYFVQIDIAQLSTSIHLPLSAGKKKKSYFDILEHIVDFDCQFGSVQHCFEKLIIFNFNSV